jgi:IS30 family transposase
MSHLTAAQRGKIEILSQINYTNKQIAKEIGCHPSTIGRELKRGAGLCSSSSSSSSNYSAVLGQSTYDLNRTNCYNRRKLNKYPELANIVIKHIQTGHDPDQIAGRLKLIGQEPRVCRETIYAWIYDDPVCRQQKLYQYLKYGKKKRGHCRVYERTIQQFKIPNRVSIHDRPVVVEQRARFGDWEGDTVIYPNKYVIASLYERLSGLARFDVLNTKAAVPVCTSIGTMLQSTVRPLTLTLDNGPEFFHHHIISSLSDTRVYFADTYSSYQRGGNEQLNRQLRRYLPRGQAIDDITQRDLQDIEDELNNKPRKRLGYRTPNEVYNHVKKHYNKVQQEGLDVSGVAFDCGG